MGTKALLAKKLIRNKKPATSSPTDNMLTPCSAKLNQTKKKHFNKSKSISKPLFGQIGPKEDLVVDEIPAEEKDVSPLNPQAATEPPLEEATSEEATVEDEEPPVVDLPLGVDTLEEEKPQAETQKINDENENPFV